MAHGRRFHPSEYAIPLDQAIEVLEMLKRYHRHLLPSAVSLMWLDWGPGTYDVDEVAATGALG
jgi:hypothetical protein